MAKQPGPGRCVHCLEHFNERNWDHVFPRSWYPDTTPQNLEKWQIPSCIPCNKKYGDLEEDLLIRLGLCINPSAAASAGIATKALRALDPLQGRNPRDRQMRQKRRERIQKEVLQGHRVAREHIYPDFHAHPHIPLSAQYTIPISFDKLHQLAKKIVRGIFYLEDGKYIEPPYNLQSYPIDHKQAAPTIAILDRYGQIYAREPGILVRRVVAAEDGMSALFSIAIWAQLTLYATVTNPAIEQLYR